MSENNIAYVRVDIAARLCLDCNGIYDRSVHTACPACTSQQSVGVLSLVGEAIQPDSGVHHIRREVRP